MNNINLVGKVALVTGANRGIGAAIARRLAEAGAHVVVSARNEAGARAVAEAIRAAGGLADAVACDVTRYGDVVAAINAGVERRGRLDIMVANAGAIEPIARIADSDPGAWGAVVDVNLKGVYHCVRAALPTMLGNGGGTIVAMNSGAANAPMEGWSHYCASKAAVQMLTRQLHKEYGEHGVRSLGLSPGPVAGEMQAAIRASGINPVSQLADSAYIPAEWAAEAVAWLCTPAADPFLGTDFSIKTEEGRRLLGLATAEPRAAA
ncbi:MAG: short-chain dehydrogenase [Proteobacteria bacterium SG_bin6]|nr:MAG: short-chain dehydrogenase [Proteobacteria bacterium SG_bin6]